jgi:hypothetical protein
LLHWKGSCFLNARDEGAEISELTPFYEAAKVMYPSRRCPYEGSKGIQIFPWEPFLLYLKRPMFSTNLIRKFKKGGGP